MSDTCFVITPIGQEHSPQRRRADRLCDQILEPALETFEPQLELKRGDRIQASGPITVQLVESITDARLVVADLADPNPNVYYELGIAESFHKPVIRFGGATAEALPFDVRDMRTIPLPLKEDGGIDVLDAMRCRDNVMKLLPVMLADDYKPTSIVSLAKRQAVVESLFRDVGEGDAQAALLSELADQVIEIKRELQTLRIGLSTGMSGPSQDQVSAAKYSPPNRYDPDGAHVLAILTYLDQKGFQMASFDRIRQRVDKSLSDERLREIVSKHGDVLRLARLKGGKAGLAKL